MSRFAPSLTELRVVQLFFGTVVDERFFAAGRPARISAGASHAESPAQSSLHSFLTPELPPGIAAPLVTSTVESFTLHLSRGLSGLMSLRERQSSVEGRHGEYTLALGDWAIVALDDERRTAFFVEHQPCRARHDLGWKPRVDRFFGHGLLQSVALVGSLLVVAFLQPQPFASEDLSMAPERVARLILDKEWPAKPTPEDKEAQKKRAVPRRLRDDEPVRTAARDRSVTPTRSAQRSSATRDPPSERVRSTGLLAAVLQARSTSATARLLSSEPDPLVTRALDRLSPHASTSAAATESAAMTHAAPTESAPRIARIDAPLVAARPDRHHPSAVHAVQETRLDLQRSAATTDGALTRDQIFSVVTSHTAAVQFCFEKELQRAPTLSGKVVLSWRVEADGRVGGARIESSTLGNSGAEGCMLRQVKAWVFPKPQGTVAQISFPFIFRGPAG